MKCTYHQLHERNILMRLIYKGDCVSSKGVPNIVTGRGSFDSVLLITDYTGIHSRAGWSSFPDFWPLCCAWARCCSKASQTILVSFVAGVLMSCFFYFRSTCRVAYFLRCPEVSITQLMANYERVCLKLTVWLLVGKVWWDSSTWWVFRLASVRLHETLSQSVKRIRILYAVASG